MANIELEEYIKDLSPELQEKARACKDINQLLALADENDIEMPIDALQGVAGGCGETDYSKYPVREIANAACRSCGGNKFYLMHRGGQVVRDVYRCVGCGKEYKDSPPYNN